MSNLNYPGEKFKITGNLDDLNGIDIPFSALVNFEITLIDERGFTLTYTKVGGDIAQGVEENTYSLEVSETDTIKLYPGEIRIKYKLTYPSSDFIDNAVDIIINKLTDLEKPN